ncbi:MAG: arylsulfatase [Pirellulaceae bacterium]|nr:arylsulfatase [Pirellulaceae bacterium]
MLHQKHIRFAVIILATLFFRSPGTAQDTLPFPPTPSASEAGVTMADSKHKWRDESVLRVAPDAPNILIILIDDAGAALPDTYGGMVHTPNLTRIANQGISYNRFHSTAMCSPTRASLLTGRNHTRIANGQISELRNDWDGFYGTIPRSSALGPEVLRHYGYCTAAFGKWHNTAPDEITSAGPYDNWPTGIGFEYFYGFLAGESSQWEPRLVRNTTLVDPTIERENGFLDPNGYHLSKDLAEDAVDWIRRQKTLKPNQPFFLYWAPGAIHGPHQVPKAFADRYKGKFDDGWDAYREKAFEGARKKGWIPQTAKLTPRPEGLQSWEEIPANERAFQSRLMEVAAGFAEHVDAQAGLILDELERNGDLENTLVFYIWGDNGSSAEGQLGTISELLAQNQVTTKVADHIRVLDELGGLEVLGGPKTDNMYHAGWSWAGSSPYQGMKLLASYLGGTRQPMAISWPKKIKPGPLREQFTHVNDIVPTLYDLLDIKHPHVVNGFTQDPIDGKSFADSLFDANAEAHKDVQFFDIMGSRAIYADGWMASQVGPRVPWAQGAVDISKWNPTEDKWELYNLTEDWSQSTDLASAHPKKLDELKALFLTESAKNKNLPIGGGLYRLLHPGDQPGVGVTEMLFYGKMTGEPEFPMPRIGFRDNTVTMSIDNPGDAEGVLYAVGGFSGGLTLFASDNRLVYEYNLFEIERTRITAEQPIPKGKSTITVTSRMQAEQPGAPMQVTIKINDKVVAQDTVKRTGTLTFTANDNFDIGSDTLSPVSEAYFDKKPFEFNGKIETTVVQLD